jgi:ubiquinone/menaquinone biosynthesis C-methylase UbiE
MCFTFDNAFRRLFHNPQKILGPYVSPGLTVLDLGPGIGYFTIPLARMVGEKGKVIAADIQPVMFKTLSRRAERRGVSARIVLRLSRPDALEVAESVDFVLIFWMLHEVPDQGRLFRELGAILKPGGRMLVVEPRRHVKAEAFEKSLKIAAEAGFAVAAKPRVAFSRAALLTAS